MAKFSEMTPAEPHTDRAEKQSYFSASPIFIAC